MLRSVLAEVHRDFAAVEDCAHVGVLVPWANTMIESELPQLCGEPVVLHYARIVPAERYRESDAFLQQLTAGVPAALAQFARLDLAGVLLGCTTIGFTTPAAPGTAELVGAFEALLAGLRRLHAPRIVLATPYPTAWTAREVEAFAAHGVEVVAESCLDLDVLRDYTAITADDLRGLVDRLPAAARANADALVLSCTAWPTLGVLPDLEAQLGIPALSSNLALAWQAIQIARTAQQR
ncbi:aspartate/glutamate racemase family protein [Dactylosporangium sp. CA-152071]|uniref:aspartate racemase/maleate isomerase family protein n=1 Tax=Dactylosporangium sp. CA-152071 TaxID=3239933 RepID=UPI003D934242